ncbi:MAG: peptide/nickel transport system ATP-binding protein ddpF [Solirubrobacteraceae bacterium]|jgi:peptide/nickel transport system ATP-binding protein|nr:peptide/nickel transport system ATP-binding protein ddpF [Solirubrobacteraceae bacterium]
MTAPAVSPSAVAAPPALELADLEVAYRVRGIWRPVLRGVTFQIAQGESYGLVGESGCGKSTAAFAIVRYLPRNGRVSSGSIRVAGEDLLEMSDADVRTMRTQHVSMVYQNPGGALNPTIRVGDQVAETYTIAGVPDGEARERAQDMLRKVQISDPVRVMRRYPHQLSGGMQQRVVIAMALAKDPTLLILDEPTTGLDATVEAEVLDLIAALRQEFGTTVLFISHNLEVITKMCDRVGVLYAGRLVEEGPVQNVFDDPRHPYAVGLLRCLPRGGVRKDRERLDTIPGFLPQLGADLPACVFVDRCAMAQDICRTEEPPFHEIGGGRFSRCHFWEHAHELPRAAPAAGLRSTVDADSEPVIRTEGMRKTFHQEGHEVRAVDDVSLVLRRGETLGLVGESGSGKTTLARALLGLTAADAGSVIELDGRPLAPGIGKRDTEQVAAVQIVFQNPDSALNRRFSVHRILSRALAKLRGDRSEEREGHLRELAQSVRFDVRLINSRPAQLSGGLKQRVAIARAFAGEPRVVVCDEPTSALDVSVQAAILNLLAELQADKGVSYLFISHDLAVVRYLSDRIAVLYLGRVMELGEAETVFHAPQHPYTEALLSSVPQADGEERPRIRLAGDIPSHADPPSGCVFHTRCPRFIGDICVNEEPPLREVEPDHLWRCHHSLEALRELQQTPPPERRNGDAPAEAGAGGAPAPPGGGAS